ncbi:hypothetical protein [Jiangella endophytica]|uniref:hypothetical protein n=1 Tax=Jiangella endophytica TaxID=1623398 RepID=UPI0013009592|nr:hypothetical protein [Jiangella endophytica]
MAEPLTGDGAAHDRRPAFSTTDRRGRMTWPAAEPRPGVVVWTFLCVVFWGVVAGALFARLFGARLPAVLEDASVTWWVVGGIVTGYLALWAAVTLYGRAKGRFGQSRAGSLLTQSAVAGGIAAGTSSVVVFAVEADERTAREVLTNSNIVTSAPAQLMLAVALTFGLWWLFATTRLPSALRHAARRRTALDDLRRHGVDHAGTLREVTFSNSWIHDQPEFTVVIGFDSREVEAYMLTTSERVPVVGSRVIVRTGRSHVTLVDLDPAVEPVFEADTRPFEAPMG